VRKKNQYIEQLRRRQEAALGKSEAGAPKPPNQMSEAELDAEVARLEREVRASKERTGQAGREDLATIGAYHAEHGIPPTGFFARLWWRLRGEGGKL
jgi:hypothetical protein